MLKIEDEEEERIEWSGEGEGKRKRKQVRGERWLMEMRRGRRGVVVVVVSG